MLKDFRELVVMVRQSLLYWERIAVDYGDAFIMAWVAYALFIDGGRKSALAKEAVLLLREMISKPSFWQYQRFLGSLAVFLWLSSQLGENNRELEGRFLSLIGGLKPSKLGILRDPYIVFMLSLGLRAIDENKARDAIFSLKSVALRERELGSLRRGILYTASLREMGWMTHPPAKPIASIEDLIVCLWWFERYGGGEKTRKLWSDFEQAWWQIALDEIHLDDSKRLLFPPEIAMLYEAAVLRNHRHTSFMRFLTRARSILQQVWEMTGDELRNF